MLSTNGHATKYEIISCGVDWITATTRGKIPSKKFDDIARAIIERDADSGYKIERQSRFGFVGYQAPSFFYGHRGRERMLMASGSRADAVALDIIPHAANVSRLDVQVTVLTDQDRPNLARHGYAHLTSSPNSRGRKTRRTLIQSSPEGDSLLLGSRRSDLYARLYDKGVESKQCEPRTLWRYEVEAKRAKALAFASAINCAQAPKTCCAGLVSSHFSDKGLEPFFTAAAVDQLGLWAVDKPNRDILEWYRSTVSQSIKKAAKRYGWATVLSSLELSDRLIVNPEEAL